MDVPEINKELLGQLQEMGFPLAHAIKALQLPGNDNIEAAINWIVDHENEFNDQTVIVKEVPIEAPEPERVQQTRMKIHEIREQMRKKKEEEQKRLEREREKERIRAGKELLQAKRVAEENERQRILAMREAEKAEEKRARETILQKLEADKAERRSRRGSLPRNSFTSEKSSKPIQQGNKKSSTGKSTSKAEQMRDCLRILKRNYKDDDAKVRRAFQTLMIYVGNAASYPDVEKYRKIRIGNPAFQERVGSLKGGIQFLELCGFERTAGGMFLYLPRDKLDMAALRVAENVLHSAVSNPFFGVFTKD